MPSGNSILFVLYGLVVFLIILALPSKPNIHLRDLVTKEEFKQEMHALREEIRSQCVAPQKATGNKDSH